MEVVAFVGPSGTGKSHRASVVAYENGIDCIIDDGILIYENRLVAGFSAKKEDSRLKAVRRAIFQDPKQVESVRSALQRIQPDRILVLGTSDRMVQKITKALGLGMPSRYIRIEDIATANEIRMASESRLKEGKHIIPLPTMELKPHFKGYLIDPIKSFFRRGKTKKNSSSEEKSVIRPVFSYYGKLVFNDAAIVILIEEAIRKTSGVISVHDVSIKKLTSSGNGLKLEFSLVILYGYDQRKLIQQVRRAVQSEIEFITGMSVNMMKISIRDIVRARK